MLRRLVLALAIVGVLAPSAAAAQLGHAGRWITDSTGRVVILHGANMVYKVAPYYPAADGFGADDAAFMERNGFNVVRVGVIWKAVEPKPGVFDDAYLTKVAATVATLAAHGIASLLDFHQDQYNERFQGEGAPDWAVQDDGLRALPRNGFPADYETVPALQRAYDHFWNNSRGPGGVGLQDRYAAAWRHVALRFRNVPGVLGYELFNEPFPGTPYLSCLTGHGCPAFDAKLTAFDHRVAAAIRAVDRRTLIFYEPNVLFDFGATTHVGALRDANAGFSWHDYCLQSSAGGCASNSAVMRNAARHVAHTHEATIMSEFGSTRSVPDLVHMVASADHYMVPWIEWAYCGCRDPTGANPTSIEAIVLNPRKPPFGSNVVASTLRALVEPYPQVVAGTPLAWSFDRATRVFRLRYSRRRADARGRFGFGALTAIATPALVYHGRYGVSVRGGTIRSRPGAGVLVIAGCIGTKTISVTVRPRGSSRETCAVP